jgi:hypothetical protein
MGIGGLDKEFSTIFRRAFASRLYPPEYIEQLGMLSFFGCIIAFSYETRPRHSSLWTSRLVVFFSITNIL